MGVGATMLTIRDLLTHATEQLASTVGHPMLEAEILLANILKQPRTYLHAWPEKNLPSKEINQFMALVARRLHGEPIAYITGVRDFWSLQLSVNPDTLIPRPETEMLVESILEIFSERDSVIKVADLGTGCGAIALSLAHERPNWDIYATDVCLKTLRVAKQNAQNINIKNVSFYQGNWCNALPCCNFDVIVSNPPYLAEIEWQQYKEGLKFEPKNALVSGADGLNAIREISQSAKRYLKEGGYVIVEHGFAQGEAVRNAFLAANYMAVYSKRDLAGWERMTLAHMCAESST